MTGHRIPPLNALRAFEATARHLSVKSAADELCVTPGAVSQLLKALEQHLGVMLFRRVNRGIFLTDAGQGYLPPIRNAFKQITEATRRITASADTASLTVSTTPFFAARLAGPAPQGIPGRLSRHRPEDRHRHGAGRFLPRRRGRRDP